MRACIPILQLHSLHRYREGAIWSVQSGARLKLHEITNRLTLCNRSLRSKEFSCSLLWVPHTCPLALFKC